MAASTGDSPDASASAAAPAVAPRIVRISPDLDPQGRALAIFGQKQGDAWIGNLKDGSRICGCGNFGYKQLVQHVMNKGITHICPGCTGGTVASAQAPVKNNQKSTAPVVVSAIDQVMPRFGDWFVSGMTITDIVRQSWELTRLYSALVSAGVADALNDTSDGAQKYTLFAPTDMAFAQLQDVPQGEALLEVLQQHLVSGMVLSRAVPLDGTTASLTSAAGTPITLRRRADGRIVVNEAALVTWKDLYASNGVVHVVTQVLPAMSGSVSSTMEGDLIKAPGNVLDIIASRADATVFSALMGRAMDQTKALAETSGNLTVFVPSDSSFIKMSDQELPKATDDIKVMFKRHACKAKVMKRHFQEGVKMASLDGERHRISADEDETIYINGVQVLDTIEAADGIVYITESDIGQNDE